MYASHSCVTTRFPNIFQEDIQTISWPEVVRRIGAIRNPNPLTELSSSSSRPCASEGAELDARDIANRTMRQENFLISFLRKNPLTCVCRSIVDCLQRRAKAGHLCAPWSGTSKFIWWNTCLIEGRVGKVFLKSNNRMVLIDGCVIYQDILEH